MRPLALITVALCLAAGVYLGIRRIETHSLPTREKATDNQFQAMALTDLSGKKFTIADYKGKVVLVNFWAAWCGPCAEEIPKFVAMQDRYRNQGLQVVGVSVEDVESDLRRFCLKNHVNYPIIAGDQAIADAFGGVLGLPTTFLIKSDGSIYKKYSGATNFAELERDFHPLLTNAGN